MICKMKPHRKKRLYLAVFIISGVSIAVGLSLYALRKSINLYYTPTQLHAVKISAQQEIRLGGVVKQGSVHFLQQGIMVNFIVTDSQQQILVKYDGILPTLFREGQGIVIEGKMNQHGIFIADQVLAKHDANYMPPGIKNSATA